MKCKRKTMCKECPFKKSSAKGWLGPWDASGIVAQALSENLLGCHSEVNNQSKKTSDKNDIYKKVNVCVGSMHFAAHSCKSYRDPEVEKYKRELGKNEEVFENRIKLYQHHESK